MTFQLVYLSQQDPQWKADILGFGDATDTIGYEGCALTSIAMLLSGYGYAETPKTLNDKLKAANGFVSASIRWDVVNQVHSQVSLKSNITCETTDAPLSQIDAALAAGQPVIVRVDSSPAPGLQWHYVLLYAKKNNDYLMLDPYPYQPDTTKEDYLMARYSQGNTLQHAIQQVLIYTATGAGGPIATPGGGSTQTTNTTGSASGIYVRPTAEVTAFLYMRSSTDISSTANVVAQINPGTQLLLLDAGAEANLGVNGQFVRARDPQGHEGYVAAWYLERVPSASTPATTTPSTSQPSTTTPTSSTSSTPSPSTVGSSSADKLKVKVTPSSGLKVYASSSTSDTVVYNEKTGAVLTVMESASGAKPKVGVKGQWIYVRSSGGKRGYVQAQYVKLA